MSTPIPADQMPMVYSRLWPTTALTAPLLGRVRNARERIALATDRWVKLSERRLAALRLLHRERRVVVLGFAGAGKTLLAVERARTLAADGAHVLMTCANRALVIREALAHCDADAVVIDEAQNCDGVGGAGPHRNSCG